MTDETKVTVEFAKAPDFSRKGLCTVELLLTDEGGNTTALRSTARVYGAPTACTLEMGTFPSESLWEILLAGAEALKEKQPDTSPKHPRRRRKTE